MSLKKDRIVTLLIMDFAEIGQIFVDDNRFKDQVVKFPNCFKNPQLCSEFIKNILALIPLEEIKAIAFIFQRDKEPITAELILKRKLRDFFQEHEIFCHFPQLETASMNAALLNIKPKVKEGECIAVIDDPWLDMVRCRIFRKKRNFYPFCDSYEFSFDQLPDVRRIILLRHKLKHIIYHTCPNNSSFFIKFGISDTLKDVQNVFSDIRFSILQKSINDAFSDAIPGIIKHLMDGNEPKYMINHFCNTEFTISPSSVICTNGDHLPFQKSVIRNIKTANQFLTLSEKESGEIKRINLNQYFSQKIKITFTLDIDMFYDIKVESLGPLVLPSVEHVLEKSLKVSNGEKIKIVFTQNHFLIFVLTNGKKKAIKNSDGLTEFPLYISFAEEKPITGKAAFEVLEEKPTFVIYDLVKLSSKNVHEIKASNWPFKLTKDSDNETFVEFDTFRGRRKTSPDFFIGMILKFALGVIEKKTEKKFEEIGIEFQGFGISKENFVECFEKAAKRINLKLTFL
uniref:Uncharacterized protein n=1 Tax=Panagrolaimus davidi TaxID=227884 RepID=A0A914QL95_9BILA